MTQVTYDELRDRIWSVLPNASIDLIDNRVVVSDTGFEVVPDAGGGEEVGDYEVSDRYTTSPGR
jgi:hypothetical protein